MSAKLTISLSPEILAALSDGDVAINITTTAPEPKHAHAAAPGKSQRAAKSGATGKRAGKVRSGSHADRLLQWAAKQKGVFAAPAASKGIGVDRVQTSMLLSRLANGAYPVQREARGQYRYTG